MQEEIELKLAIPAGQMSRLRRLGLMRSLTVGRAAKRTMVSTYFDTPEFALKRAGMALRVRDMGDHKLQTLKAPVPGAIKSGLQHMAEYETAVEEGRPDVTKLDDPVLRQWIEDQNLPQQIGPVFTTRIERTLVPLRLVDSDIELAIDEGSIEASGRETPLSEIELELKSGRSTRLYELALMLVQEGLDLRLETKSKAARGYGLYERKDEPPVKAEPLDLPRGVSVKNAFMMMVRNCYEHLRANEPAVLKGEDPEGVHQMRVATRRLRALLSLFKPVLAAGSLGHLKEELRWLQQQLGPARDWDVFLTETLAPMESRLPAEDGLSVLRDKSGGLRAKAYERAREVVTSRRYTGLLLRLQLHLADDGWFKTVEPGEADPLAGSMKDFAAGVLSKRSKRLAKLGNKHAELTELQLHQLRIEGKKLRYAVEFFSTLYPKPDVKLYRKSLVGIQDSLGALNDAVVGHRLLDELEVEMRSDERVAPETACLASGLLLGWHAARITDHLSALPGVWKAHRKLKRFWA
ncbi:MAG: CYTH and CHAD domain-containing protein [Limibacillus sp.]|jgi:triphosphatase